MSSLSESGTIGNKTFCQMRGLIMFLSASLHKNYTTDVSKAKLQLTTTIDFSSKTAFQSQKKSSNVSREKIGVQSQMLSTE